jgi:RNA polymerase-binding transcription factor DksA
MADPLLAAHQAAVEQVAGLSREWDEIVAATEGANADDEHDPEGATIAFERQQVAALLAQAHASVEAAAAALAARDAGRYGTCERCGAEIGAERLEARPSASTCITCARAERPRR